MAKSLFPDAGRSDVFLMDPATLHIETDPSKPFCDAHSNALDLEEALVRNIQKYGVKEPIVVKKDDEGRAVVVDGRRRTRHAIEANLRLIEEGETPLRVPVIPHRGSDQQASDAMYFLNLMRRTIPPMVQAEQIAEFCAAGRTPEDAALVFGIPASGIKAHLALADAPKAVKGLVEKGLLSVSAAVKVAKMDDVEIEAFLSEQAEKGRPVTVAKVAKKVKERAGDATPPSRKEIKQELERLRGAFGEDYALVSALEWVLTGKRRGAMEIHEDTGKKIRSEDAVDLAAQAFNSIDNQG